MRAMTKRKALEIILAAARRDYIGAGCGLREERSWQQRQELKEAIEKLAQ